MESVNRQAFTNSLSSYGNNIAEKNDRIRGLGDKFNQQALTELFSKNMLESDDIAHKREAITGLVDTTGAALQVSGIGGTLGNKLRAAASAMKGEGARAVEQLGAGEASTGVETSLDLAPAATTAALDPLPSVGTQLADRLTQARGVAQSAGRGAIDSVDSAVTAPRPGEAGADMGRPSQLIDTDQDQSIRGAADDLLGRQSIDADLTDNVVNRASAVGTRAVEAGISSLGEDALSVAATAADFLGPLGLLIGLGTTAVETVEAFTHKVPTIAPAAVAYQQGAAGRIKQSIAPSMNTAAQMGGSGNF